MSICENTQSDINMCVHRRRGMKTGLFRWGTDQGWVMESCSPKA